MMIAPLFRRGQAGPPGPAEIVAMLQQDAVEAVASG